MTDPLVIVGTPEGSTIDAANLDRVFDVRGTSLTMQGVTVTGGQAERGGGVSVVNGSLVLTDSVFTDNAVVTDEHFSGGGAIYAESSTLTVTGSEFTDNAATTTAPGDVYGGAIYLASGASATISDSTFTGNETHSPESAIGGAIGLLRASSLDVSDTVFESNTAGGGIAYGGAIGSFFSGPVHIEDSALENNEAISSGAFGFAVGGAISLVGTSGVIEDTTIAGNLAKSSAIAWGGGIYFFFGNRLEIRDSSITGNRAEGPFSQGGGVYAVGPATADEDTTISGNQAGTDPDAFGVVIVPS